MGSKVTFTEQNIQIFVVSLILLLEFVYVCVTGRYSEDLIVHSTYKM